MTMTMLVHTVGTGRPLVLIGGGVTGWLSWIPHQQRLASTRRVARAQPLIVQLGLENRALPPGYAVEMESAGLAAAVDAMRLEGPVDLVAWSYGGVITLDYALGHPDGVRTLTLIEPPAFWVLDATGTMEPAFARERDALSALGETMRDDVTEAELEAFVHFARLCPPGVQPKQLPQWPSWLEHRRSLRGQVDAVLGHSGDADRLRRFDRPVLLVKGTGSTPVLHGIIHALAGTLPRAQVLELAGGHAPHIAEMDTFLVHLARFHENPDTPR